MNERVDQTDAMPGAERARLTYRYDRWRALSGGVIEAAGSTFLLLIAVRYYEAGAMAKALIAGGSSFGFILAPLTVSWVENHGWATGRAASRLYWMGAGMLLLAAAFPVLPLYILASVVSMAGASACVPLLTQIYQENYPAAQRGTLFTRAHIIRIGMAALASQFGGSLLTEHIGYFRLLLVVFALAFAFAGFCFSRFPSKPLRASGPSSHPFRSLRFARDDRLFRHTLICWMLMGFATLMMQPLRIEYLANSKYGIQMEVVTVALITGVVPNAVRLVLSPVWGWLFDRMNFFVLRITLNLGFALGIFSFFTSNDLGGLLFGAVIFGISNAGGDVAWSLWVTKFAPPDRVADYMSAHTFFTGLRGVVAPVVAFYLVERVSLAALGGASALMILVATLMLLPEIKQGRRGRPDGPLSEEVSE